MLRLQVTIAAFVFGVGASSVGISACAQSAIERDDPYQETSPPYIRGVAYDVGRERVFVSLCARREFACDLLVADRGGEAARIFNTAGPYGYTSPAVSGDGSQIAAVRTARSGRPSERNVEQAVVVIDADSHAERVLAQSRGGRFDRIKYLGGDAILAVRSFRSSEAVRCSGDVCTDWAEFLVLDGPLATTLPIEASAANGLGRGGISIMPLAGEGRLWIRAAAREATTVGGGMMVRRSYEWILNGRDGLVGPAHNEQEARALLAQAPLGAWRISDFWGNPEFKPFNNTSGDRLSLDQTTLAGPDRGAFVRKVRRQGRVYLQVEAIARDSENAWRTQWSSTVEIPRI